MALLGVSRLPLAQYWNESHNLKVVGSNPTPATTHKHLKTFMFSGVLLCVEPPSFGCISTHETGSGIQL